MSGVLMRSMGTSCAGSLVPLVLSLCVPAVAQDVNDDLGSLAMKAVIGLVGPQPTDQRRSLSAAPSETVSVRAQAILPLGDEAFVVACTETVASKESARVDRVVAARMATNGRVLAHKAGPSALPGESSRCQGVGVLGQPTPGQPWSLLELRYQSRHDVAAGEAVIDWTAVVDPQSMQLVRRVPIRLGLRPLDGPSRLELFETQTVSHTSAELKARTTGRKVLVPCAAVCVIEPATVLTLVAG